MSIRHLCELLQINRAWYYARQHILAEPSKRAEEGALRDAIEQVILDFAGYGYRRVTHALQRDGWKVNHKRVLRIMREESDARVRSNGILCTPLTRATTSQSIRIW